MAKIFAADQADILRPDDTSGYSLPPLFKAIAVIGADLSQIPHLFR